MPDYEPERTVLVNIGDFGISLSTDTAVELDDQGVAHNLMTGTEYAVLNAEETQAYISGEVEYVRENLADMKFSVLFPGLDRMKTSITAQHPTIDS